MALIECPECGKEVSGFDGWGSRKREADRVQPSLLNCILLKGDRVMESKKLAALCIAGTLALALSGCGYSGSTEVNPQKEAAIAEEEILSTGAVSYASMHDKDEIQSIIDNHYGYLTDEGKTGCLLALSVKESEEEVVGCIMQKHNGSGALYSTVDLTGYYPNDPVLTNTGQFGSHYDFSAEVSYSAEMAHSGHTDSESETAHGGIVVDIEDKFTMVSFDYLL
ncbi:hypothetical protein H8S61_05905 [Eggerthella sp. NSJ-70]|uniref:Uncharacterized protein n=1 Tax=Eggerthella hominis TaxID=2763043 RepID=A0ABR7BRI5_9ACTN|nr:hypothetical protein [Eggerthella hominis]MBC5583725.1 hypothetical protein [Eggerthella hominis]